VKYKALLLLSNCARALVLQRLCLAVSGLVAGFVDIDVGVGTGCAVVAQLLLRLH
jgi:hypothetical protein